MSFATFLSLRQARSCLKPSGEVRTGLQRTVLISMGVRLRFGRMSNKTDKKWKQQYNVITVPLVVFSPTKANVPFSASESRQIQAVTILHVYQEISVAHE